MLHVLSSHFRHAPCVFFDQNHTSYFPGGMVLLRVSRLAGLPTRSFHFSQSSLANVAISKFEKDKYLPYEKLEKNVKIVKDRCDSNITDQREHSQLVD